MQQKLPTTNHGTRNTQHASPTEIRAISTAETLPLRLSVLRPGRPVESAHFAGDDSPGTRHFGAFREGRLLGIASLYAVDLRNAQLLRTDLSRTDMRDTKLEHAVLSFANLEQTAWERSQD